MKKYFYLVLGLIMISCSSPLDKNYNKETMQEDLKQIGESGNVDDDEKKLIAGWIFKSGLTGESLEGKSYSDILEEAKNYKKEQEELAARAQKEEEERRSKLGAALTVAMYDKGYEEFRYQEYLTYGLAFKNKSDKNIRAFKGSLSIKDLFDTEIKSINLTIDDPIKAGETHKATYTTDYNQFMDSDSRLKNKDLDDLVIVWNPEKIIFDDGTTLE
ncbi:hypothetical protein [Christiangramia sabulilitoris]|uniref:Lipoprotein n=1 Tax=Christiangramia sabulilitoris TaxID=2583991 RepID=A0A550I3C2_9FLAO|nr:hypothetical protein [Christiangramia sabulilitoris]TRO65487.1 hypothetical protein FGM01_08800 [Christiangramia sabulilitoris]